MTTRQELTATRQAAEKAAEIVESPAEEITTKAATEISDNGQDMIMTEFGWVTVTRVLVDYSRRSGKVFSIRFNGRYSFGPTDQVQVHPDPKSYRHERFQASRRAMQELTAEAAKIR
jgi:hypothetical protein